MERDPTQRLSSFADADTLPSAELAAGTSAGAWRIEELHARGGFGSVYRAAHAVDGRRAAIKVLHRFLQPSRSARERFAREIAVVQRIVHANVVPLWDAGSLDDGRPFYAMEWIEGPSLDRVIHEGALALDVAVRIMEGICAGVAAAHAAGVLHRDLKAANVLLAPGEAPAAVRLVDFGIARLLDDEAAAALTASGLRVGTPTSMAPEQISGAPLSPATDVYALGVLLFHMLTARLPFEAETAVEVQAMHLAEPPPLAGQLVRVPAAIDQIITRCLDKTPARRFPDAPALAQALSAALQETTPARSVQTARRVGAGVHVQGGTGSTLADARREALAAGFQIVREWPDALFVAQLLAEADAEAARERAAVVAFATRLAKMGLRVRVHAAPVKTLVAAGAARIVGGELLAFESWPELTESGSISGLVISHAISPGTTRA